MTGRALELPAMSSGPDKRPGHGLTAVAARRERLALAQSNLSPSAATAPVDTGDVTLQSCSWHLDHLLSLAQGERRGGLPATCGTVNRGTRTVSGQAFYSNRLVCNYIHVTMVADSGCVPQEQQHGENPVAKSTMISPAAPPKPIAPTPARSISLERRFGAS